MLERAGDTLGSERRGFLCALGPVGGSLITPLLVDAG